MSTYFERERERINARTAHEFHKVEFRDMAAKMIEEALQQHDQ